MGKAKDDQPSLYVGSDGKLCLLAFNEMDIPEPSGPTWILGNIFLTKYLVLFDRKNLRIGLGDRDIIKISPY
jgi:cathepsin E